jgi:hypothetical protein
MDVPEELTPVPKELAPAPGRERAAARRAAQRSYPRSPAPQRYSGPPPQFDLAQFLGKYGIRHRGAVAYDGGYKYVLEECPFDASAQSAGLGSL